MTRSVTPIPPPLTPLELAAVAWWRRRCPVVYTQAEHLADPTVGTLGDAERRLARAVARVLRKRSKKPAVQP